MDTITSNEYLNLYDLTKVKNINKYLIILNYKLVSSIWIYKIKISHNYYPKF